MTSMVLEGTTLGKRQQHYNDLLKAAIANSIHPAEIDYNKTDVENLINIDIANINKDVKYILNVLKGDDMLYVQRAIKLSNWLISNEQFAHIIEPHYLHTELFPQMMPKASSKFLLHIRLNLKNESRCDQFFNYLRENNVKAAVKWLPRCSLGVIETNVARHAQEILPDTFKRLCQRSNTVLEIFVEARGGSKTEQLQAAMILLRQNPEKYLDALTNYERYYCYPSFGKKQTEFVMKKCPHRFIDKFEKFANSIDIDTFAKYFKREDIESFILKHFDSFEDPEKICMLIKYMPTKGKYELIQQLHIKSQSKEVMAHNSCIARERYDQSLFSLCGVKHSIEYCWYKYAPFDVTFADFKKMIPTEANPDKRKTMLMVLIINARSDLTDIHSLLQYYCKSHINEPFQSKLQFVNNLINETNLVLYDDETWNILEVIFRSMEVYNLKSDNNVETCVKSIVVRKIMLGQPVPDIIQQKLKFCSWKSFAKKLNGNQKDKLFVYLYNTFLSKLNKHLISNEIEFGEYVELFKQGLNLLKDWEKELPDFPDLINKIKDCAEIKKEKGWNTSLSVLYDTKKSWKKFLFQESIILSPSQFVCINALKHDPELLMLNEDEVRTLRFNNNSQMKQLLHILRVYWPLTIATEWISSYLERLDDLSSHKAVVQGLCYLQNQQKMINFLKKYEPLDTEVTSTDTDELIFSLRKNIARYMHIARPQIKPDAVMTYAKGDYVQYTLPSLDAILCNQKLAISQEGSFYLPNDKNRTPQKHEINQIFLEIWQSTTNVSIRAAVFQHTHDRLCKEHNEAIIAELWRFLQMFMDNLTDEKSERIFNTFRKLTHVHPSIMPALFMKSYKILKSLPPKTYIENKIENKILRMKMDMEIIIEQLDSDFVADIILEFIDQVLVVRGYTFRDIEDVRLFVPYFSTARDESTQLQRYEKVFAPFMEKSLFLWDETDNHGCYYVRENFENILSLICEEFKKNDAKPTALYNKILKRLETALPDKKHYECLYHD